MNLRDTIDLYYNLGSRAIEQIDNYYSEHHNTVLINTTLAVKLRINLDEKDDLSIEIPNYRYRYRGENRKLIKANELSYNELMIALEKGYVVKEPIISGYNKYRLYGVPSKDIDIDKYRLDINKVCTEIGAKDEQDMIRKFKDEFKVPNIEIFESFLDKTKEIDRSDIDDIITILSIIRDLTEQEPLIDTQYDKYIDVANNIVTAYQAIKLHSMLHERQ